MIRRGVHKSVQALEADIRAWAGNWNENPRPFAWTKTAEEILDSLARYLARISPAAEAKYRTYNDNFRRKTLACQPTRRVSYVPSGRMRTFGPPIPREAQPSSCIGRIIGLPAYFCHGPAGD
jgi:hypothetical protein